MKPQPTGFRRLSLILILLLAAACLLQASPAWRGMLQLTQPDGTLLPACLSGDEHGHLLLTPDGCSLVQDDEGWWCYARYDYFGKRINTGVHAGDPAAPGAVIAASRDIPYSLLSQRRTQRLARMQALRQRQPAAPRTRAGEGEGGFRHGLIILAEFQDLPFQHTREDFERIINGSGPDSALSYFKDQWKDTYSFRFDISGIVTLPQNYAYYGANNDEGDDQHPDQMVIDACEGLGTSIDFSVYDYDGDGEVDNVFIFFAGPNESEGAGDNYIWPHMWYLQDGAGRTYVRDGVLVNNYACTSELMLDDNRQTYTTFATIGTFCHEYTHTFGIPDLYDTDEGESTGYAEALWKSIDLMDAGNYNNRGRTPPNYSAVERWFFGTGEGRELTKGAKTLRPIQENGEYFFLRTDTEGEIYLLECREQKGWDAYIGGNGLLVYHIDRSERRIAETLPGVSFDGTALDLWGLNQVNVYPDHQCVDLLEPDPLARQHYQDAIRNRNYDAIYTLASHAFWPYGDATVLTGDTDVPFRFWSGEPVPLGLSDIRRNADGSVSFTVFDALDDAVPAVKVDDQLVFQDATILQWSSEDPSFTGKSVLRYGPADATRLTEVEVEPYEQGKYACVVDGLSPTTAYKVQLLLKKGDIPGPVNSNAAFTTKAGTKAGSYPYIYLKNIDRGGKDAFPAGAPLCLRVYNATDASVRWYFDNREITPGPDGFYHLTRSGTLKAVVSYPDNTDIITKDIVVQ